MPNTVADDVAAYVRKGKPKAYCDDCIAKALSKNRRQIQAITAALGAAGFSRSKRTCAGCASTTKFAVSA